MKELNLSDDWAAIRQPRDEAPLPEVAYRIVAGTGFENSACYRVKILGQVEPTSRSLRVPSKLGFVRYRAEEVIWAGPRVKPEYIMDGEQHVANLDMLALTWEDAMTALARTIQVHRRDTQNTIEHQRAEILERERWIENDQKRIQAMDEMLTEIGGLQDAMKRLRP